MLEYDNPICDVWEELNEIRQHKVVLGVGASGVSNNNSFKSGYTVREFSDIGHFLTACRPDRLSNTSKTPRFPAEFDVTFVDPKTCDRVQIGIHYPDATRGVVELTTLKTEKVYNKAKARGFFVNKPINDMVKFKEKRVRLANSADVIYNKMKEVANRLKAAGYRVLDPDEDFFALLANCNIEEALAMRW